MTETTEQPQSASSPNIKLLLNVAWLSVILGIFIQIVLLIVLQKFSMPAFIQDASQKVAWSFIVCMGIAIGTTVANTRPMLTGLMGLLAAPIGFVIAKSAHKSVGAALSLAGAPDQPAKLFWSILIIKAIEYAIFGLLVNRLSSNSKASYWQYLGLGSLIGLIFSGSLILVQVYLSPTAIPAAKLVGLGVNEFIFRWDAQPSCIAANCLPKHPSTSHLPTTAFE